MKKQESGRSMVEMLGVLAIIGVLSIGGIAGYTLSMRRFRVNNALDLVNKYALTTYSACQSKMLIGAAANLAACNKTTGTDAKENSVAFLESGLGGLPSGVKAITTPTFTAVTAGKETASNKNENSDAVSIAVLFSDVELCKTAASITGGTVAAASIIAGTKENANRCGTTEATIGTEKGYGFNFVVYMN